MPKEIILQQIDVIVVGPKKYSFLQLVLQKQFKYQQQSSSSSQSQPIQQSINSYIKILKKFFNASSIYPNSISSSQNMLKSTSQLSSPNKSQVNKSRKQTPKKQLLKQKQKILLQQQHQHQTSLSSQQQQRTSLDEQGLNIPLGLKTFCGIQKFSKMIQTQSFWLTINFYITDLKIYDPVLSQYTRGQISIGIIVSDDQSGLLDNIKIYLNGNNNNNNNNNNNQSRQPPKVSRAENNIEAKINSRIHSPCINGFNSLLCLRLRDKNRLVEESNNLRLTNNQIFRWIVDRYFENKYRIKLKQSLGDQIERATFKQKQTKNQTACVIM